MATKLDALGTCGGMCEADDDGDGVCDDVDSCVGEFDACGICNGPGAIYECGCEDIPDGDCDCNGNQLDALGTCGGTCEADDDGDGVCDDVDIASGNSTHVASATGQVPFTSVGARTSLQETATATETNSTPLACGGTCEADVDGDGMCDDVDSCVGAFDACGICNGPGEIYECGCDALGHPCRRLRLTAMETSSTPWACGGTCEADDDGDGVCDDVDSCVGEFDACGICNGPGAIYECGCEDIPAGDCDCNGNQLDALGDLWRDMRSR